MPEDFSKGNLVSHLAETARSIPDQLAIIPAQTKQFAPRTFAELYSDTSRCAEKLRNSGLQKGDKSLLFVRPGYDLIVLAFGMIHLGVVPIIIDPGMGIKSVLSCIRTTKPNFLVGIPLVCWLSNFFPGVFSSIKGRLKIRSSSFRKEIVTPSIASIPPAKSSQSDLAAIVFTSGSTGKPKGVRYLHKTFNAQVYTLKKYFKMQVGEIDLATLPIFALFNPALGITTIIPEMNPRKPALANAEKLVQAIQKFGVTSAFASPVVGEKIQEWSARNSISLPSMKRIFLAGAPSTPKLVEKLSKILTKGEVYLPYGATEALPIAQCNSKEIATNKKSIEEGSGSLLGSPISGVSVSIFPISKAPFSEDVQELKGEEVGEICVSGDIVSDGYYKMPGATMDARFKYGGRIFHRMGDLGYYDRCGQLRFLGRKAEQIMTENGPLETERCEPIVNALEGIRRSALIGIGPNYAKEPCIVIELENEKLDKKIVQNSIRQSILSVFPSLEIKRIFWERSIPVDSRHNAKIHRLKLTDKWNGVVSEFPKAGLIE